MLSFPRFQGSWCFTLLALVHRWEDDVAECAVVQSPKVNQWQNWKEFRFDDFFSWMYHFIFFFICHFLINDHHFVDDAVSNPWNIADDCLYCWGNFALLFLEARFCVLEIWVNGRTLQFYLFTQNVLKISSKTVFDFLWENTYFLP